MNNNKEAEDLLNEFIKIRNNFKKDKSYLTKYNKLRNLCLKKFDYLINLKTYRYKFFSNYDDLRQDGRLALLSALESYHPKKGSFYWWANWYIKTKISRQANKHSTIKFPINSKVSPYKVTNFPLLVDSSPSSLETIEQNEIKKIMHNAIGLLPKEQREVIELNSINHYSISKISKKLNISKNACVKRINNAKNNIKSILKQTTDLV